MNISEFMEQNNITIVARIDLKKKFYKISKRDFDLESFDLFEQLILYSSIDRLLESLEGQIFPRIWGQGNTKCVFCKPNNEEIVALFFDNCMDAKENYFFAKKLDLLLQEVLTKEN